jgi:hypothetical protein
MKTITKQFARLFLLAVCLCISTASMMGQVTVTAQGEINANEGIAKLTDGSIATKWLDNTDNTDPYSSWVQFAYVGAEKWNQYAITSGNDEPSRDPKNWTISGSNNGTSWTVLDTRTNETWSARNATQTYQFTNSTYYLYYKWDITAFNGANMTQVTEFAFSYVSTDDEIVPTVPANLSVGAITKNSVALSWTHSVNVMGVTTYDVYKNGSLAGSTTSNNFTATGLAASTLYSFYVIAKDGFGSAAATDAVTATTAAAPLIPTYRYLKLTANARTDMDVYYNEIEWMVDSTPYPTVKLADSSPTVTATLAGIANWAADWKAFDGNTGTAWVPINDTGIGYPYSITLDLGAGNEIYPTAIKIGVGYKGRSLSAFTCEGSNDNSNWVNLLTVTGKTKDDWTSDVLNSFTIPEPVLPTTVSTATNISALSGLNASTDINVASGGTLTVDASQSVNSVTIQSGGKLTVADGQTLTLASLTLKSDANGTSTYVPTGTLKNGAIVVTGTTAVEQYLTYTRNYYVSSPVSNAVAPAGYTYYGRNEPGGTETGWTAVSVGAGLTAGKGYIALPGTAGVPITFTTQSGGTLNNGTITIPLTYTTAATSGKGYNLIGNPYPSHLSWTHAFTQANSTKIESSIWYRTKASNGNTGGGWSFVTFNPTTAETVPSTENGGLIPPMQAFWVLAKQTTSIQFTNDMRSHQANNPLRAPAAKNLERKKVRLQLSNGTNTDEALIVFDANASNGYDAYDSPKMMNNAADIADIYTISDNKKLVINGLNAISDNMILPLGYNAGAEGGLRLKVSEMTNFDSNMRMYLVDGQTETELVQGTEYAFNTSAITGNESRFSLLFRAPGATTGIENGNKLNAQVFVNAANQITIIAPEKANYSIYNAVGQQVMNGIATSNHQTSNIKLSAGMYVVKVGNQSTRIIIK